MIYKKERLSSWDRLKPRRMTSDVGTVVIWPELLHNIEINS